MHVYFLTRGTSRNTRNFIEEVENEYLNFRNKETGKSHGVVQIMPRKIRSWECVFPAEHKKRIKEILNKCSSGKVSIHFGPFKKDKFIKGEEQL